MGSDLFNNHDFFFVYGSQICKQTKTFRRIPVLLRFHWNFIDSFQDLSLVLK